MTDVWPEFPRLSTGEMLLSTAAPCEVHRRHVPRSHVNERHHIHPLGFGGPDDDDNIVVVCSTGHNNIHMLLRLWIQADGDPGPPASRFTSGEQKYAKLGFERIKQSGNTPPA